MSSLSQSARLASVLVVLSAASCAIYVPQTDRAAAELRGDTLADAEKLIKLSRRIRANEEVASVYQLRAAEIAWGSLDTDGGKVADVNALGEDGKHALRIIDEATEQVAVNFIGAKYKPEKTYRYAGFSYRVSAGIDQKPGIYPLAGLESAKPARKVRHTLTANWHTEDGVGVACAPKWKRPDDKKMQRFVTQRGYLEPITAVMAFDGKSGDGSRAVSITGYDPTYQSTVTLGATTYPLEADYTAPIVEQTNDINEFTEALTGLIHPGGIDSKLILLEPFDKERIPVLLVHGLNSHPRMWRDVINDLRADPKLRGKYQFMLFYYPTAWPISYSSMRLREELGALQETVGPTRPMLVIGHSMGGLLSRMQVVNPGREIWNEEFGKDADRLYAKLPANNIIKRSLLFEADPHIGREVYVCTPHRGSGLSDLSLTSWFIKLIKLPSTLTGAFIDLPSNLIERGRLTSVAGLSPSNPLYQSLNRLPIQVPYHSIIGDRGKGNSPNSSDGVVPYWSSHLDGAQSEVVVADGHGAYDDPEAIREMRRILLLHAGIKD
ncbi:MAG: alpha/beta fold hydrolase [Verrucomicrobiota bacterium]